MAADRAGGRCDLALVDEPAVPAVPCYRHVCFEDFTFLHTGEEFFIPAFVVLFDPGDLPEQGGDLFEPLVISSCRKTGIKSSPLHHLSRGSSCEVLLCAPDDPGGIRGGDLRVTAFELFEEDLCMLLLFFCGLQKDRTDLLVSLFLCCARKEAVPVPCLGLAGKCGKQVLLGCAAFEIHKYHPPVGCLP